MSATAKTNNQKQGVNPNTLGPYSTVKGQKGLFRAFGPGSTLKSRDGAHYYVEASGALVRLDKAPSRRDLHRKEVAERKVGRA